MTDTLAASPPPAPLRYSPGKPPRYGDIGGGTNNTFNPTEMQTLSHILGGTADNEITTFIRQLDAALEPPPSEFAPVKGAPASINPIPPDADEATGNPDAYLAIANELRNAAGDIAGRAQKLLLAEAPITVAVPDMQLIEQVADVATDTAEDAAAAAGEQGPVPVDPQTTAEVVQEPEWVQEAVARDLLDRFPPDKVLNEPRKLQELARELDAHAGQEIVAQRVIERFGAEDFVAVPRTLQAWQYGRVDIGMGGLNMPAHERTLRNDRAHDRPDEGEIEQILHSFSATMATATTSHRRLEGAQKELEEIVEHNDSVALSWLLTNHDSKFDTAFLVRAFDHVKANIEEESRRAANLISTPNYATGPITGPDGQALNNDPKVAILNAISRNPEAALAIQTEKIDPPMEIAVFGKGEVDVTNTMDLLYAHGTFGDQGAALGRMLHTAHDQIQALADFAGRETEAGKAHLRQANELTLRMAHEAAYGRKEIDRTVIGLAPILARQHMGDLQSAVTQGFGADYGLEKSMTEAAGQDQVIGRATADRVELSGAQVEAIVTSLCADPDAQREFAKGMAGHQARVFAENLTKQESAGQAEWAKEIGLLTGIYVNASGNHAMAEFEAAEARRAQQLALFDTVMELVPVVGGALGQTAGKIVDGVLQYGTLPVADFEQMVKDIHFVAPSRDAVLANIEDFEKDLTGRLAATLASVALEAGLLGDRMALKGGVEAELRAQADRDGLKDIPTFFTDDGHLIKVGDLTHEQRSALNRWLYSDKVDNVIGPALNDVKLSMLTAIRDR